MIKTEETTIDGVKVTVTQFPARLGLKIKVKLMKLAAPAIATATGALKGGLDAEIDSVVLGAAVKELVSNLDQDVIVDFIITELLQSTRLNDKELTEEVFDMEFSGNYSLLYKVIGYVLKVNYSDFFGKSGIGLLASRFLKTEQAVADKEQEN